MRYFVSGVLLALAMANPVRADSGLTAAVAATWGQRTVDSGLHAIAHERVLEISACSGCMSHDLMRSGTAEVLGFNAGYSDPTSTVIASWLGSAAHNGILSDHDLGRIGCAEAVVNGDHYFACVLASGGVFGSAGQPTVVTLPNTAMH